LAKLGGQTQKNNIGHISFTTIGIQKKDIIKRRSHYQYFSRGRQNNQISCSAKPGLMKSPEDKKI
jgi:hypothetical protein